MSTKTLRKRIALVAVSALGAGLLSVVSGPSAFATGAGAEPTAESAYIGKVASTTGSASTATTVNSSTDKADAVAVGVITTSANSVSAAASTATGTILTNAQVPFLVASASKIGATVSGGYFTKIAQSDGDAKISSDLTSATLVNVGGKFTVVATPNVAAGSVMTVSFYQGANISATAPSAGTLIGIYNLTVAASGSSGTYNATYSAVNTQTPQTKGTACTTAGSNAYDYGLNADNGKVACIYVSLKDAYNAGLTTGTLAASATNSALVKMGGAASDGYTASAAFDSAAYTAATYVSVVQPTANVAGSTTVTITWQGLVVGTKTINWNGDAASIELDTANSNSVFYNGGSTWDTVPAASLLGIVYKVKDNAGNVIAWSTYPAVSNGTGSMVTATLDASGIASRSALQTIAAGAGYSSMYIGASSASGAGTYKLKITNARGTDLYSPEYKATVAGGAYTFDVAWDKASYKSGEIATLTISAKDSNGNPVADGTTLGTGTAISVNADGFDHLTTACKTTPETSAKYSGGSKTCTFAVLNTPGSYSYSVKVANGSGQVEKTGTVAVVSASSSVTNAEVLAAIVKLIASINKQITALQKLLTKKK